MSKKYISAVYLEWADHNMTSSHGGSAWLDIGNLDNKPSIIKTVGFIITEDAKYITVCSCYDGTVPSDVGCVKGVSTIVKSCIIKRRRITL